MGRNLVKELALMQSVVLIVPLVKIDQGDPTIHLESPPLTLSLSLSRSPFLSPCLGIFLSLISKRENRLSPFKLYQ